MFRFTTRDLLWLTVVVGLAVALWQERWALMLERQNSAQWTSRADAALQVIKTRETFANWDENGVLVQQMHGGAIVTKVYRGSPK
jgi:hypothetical protein